MRTSILWMLTLTLTACSGDDSGNDASTNDATSDVASEGATDAGQDADAPVDAPSCATYEAGPTFGCYQSTCTGSVAQFCENLTDAGAGLVGSTCVDTPAPCTCLGMHTCACILANLPNPCDGGTPKCTGAGAYQQAYVTCK